MPYIKRNINLPNSGGTKAKANGGTKGVGGKNALGNAAAADTKIY
jgi:hypothetical protein